MIILLTQDKWITGQIIHGIPVHAIPCHSSNYAECQNRIIKYIVMHYTGNAHDNARANANYFANNASLDASAHFFTDDNNIYQSVELKNRAWHCGAKTYRHSECRNQNSIGIEMCCTNNYTISEETKENAAQLCAHICIMIGINTENVEKYVIRHWDVTGKNCPAQMTGDYNAEWTAFLDRVRNIIINLTSTALPSVDFEGEDEEMIRYNTVAECPEWAKDCIQFLVDKKYLADPLNLNLSEDMLRIFVVNYRAGLYK